MIIFLFEVFVLSMLGFISGAKYTIWYWTSPYCYSYYELSLIIALPVLSIALIIMIMYHLSCKFYFKQVLIEKSNFHSNIEFFSFKLPKLFEENKIL